MAVFDLELFGNYGTSGKNRVLAQPAQLLRRPSE